MRHLIVVLALVALFPAVRAAEQRPISVAVGQEFEIVLESLAGNNCQWLLAKPLDEQRIKSAGRKNRKQAVTGAEARNFEVLRYQALAEGTVQIHLKYASPFEGNKAPLGSTNFLVVITKRVAPSGR